MSLEELNKKLQTITGEYNARPLSEFEGLSPHQMHNMLNNSFGENSPILFRKNISEETLNSIPFLKLSESFLKMVGEKGSVKLTAFGNLPLDITKRLYEKKIIQEYYIDLVNPLGITRRILEQDWPALTTVRAVCHVAGLITKKNNKLSLSKKGIELLKEGKRLEMFKEIFIAYTAKFNWGYTDGYGDHPIGQFGFGFLLFLLSKYGHTELEARVYAEKYLKAFPTFLDQIEIPKPYKPKEEMIIDCFSSRFFERFAFWFGLVVIRQEKRWDGKLFVLKTTVLNEIFDFG